VSLKNKPVCIAITQDGETQEWDEVRYDNFSAKATRSQKNTGGYWRIREPSDSERIIAREMDGRGSRRRSMSRTKKKKAAKNEAEDLEVKVTRKR